MTQVKYRVLDLFCGAGGFSYGLSCNQEYEIKMGVDFNNSAIKTFSQNHPNSVCICGDLCDISVKAKILKDANELGVNMIIGGPPCQGFSLKGKNKGLNDPRNYLFLEYYDLVKSLRPEVFIIENVKNMISSANGYFINEIERQFESIGYNIEKGILNSKYFGVPQSRERAIVIGCLTKRITLPTIYINSENILTVRDAISDLAYLNSGEGSIISEYQKEPESTYQLKMRSNTLQYHISTLHSKDTLKKLSLIPPEKDKSYLPEHLHGKQKFNTTWSRLEWDKPSPTIDTRFDTPSNGRNSHPFLNRSITPREAARLQSFPDSFHFIGCKSEVCKQIGNAVPPLLAKELGGHIIKEVSSVSVSEDKCPMLLNGDAYLEINKLLLSNIRVDHIITDPPYNISAENNFATMENPRKGVDFGDWDHGNFDLYSWIDLYTKLLNKNGSIIIFCSYRNISHIIERLDTNSIVAKDVIVWQKSNPMPRNTERRYVQDMEFAIWGVHKNAKWIFNKPLDASYLRAFFTTATVSGAERTAHPTQKSLKLMEEIISIHTNKGDTILDPFMGSGTTGVAALKLRRKFIGIEKSPEYFKIARNRILQNSYK